MIVTHELEVDSVCAYVISYGEYEDGTNTADERCTKAMTRWTSDELMGMSVGDEIPGYAPIFTCDYCGDESEGEQWAVVILGKGEST